MKTATMNAVIMLAIGQMQERFGGRASERAAISSSASGAVVTLRTTFNVEATVELFFSIGRNGKAWDPKVRVNVPALNGSVTKATAFLALLQEATMFAATLQCMLDEFEIPFE